MNWRLHCSELWTVNLAEIVSLLIGTKTWGQLAVVRQHVKTWAESCLKCSVNSVRGHHHLALTWLYCVPLWCNIISKWVREFPSLPFCLLTSWLQCSFSDKVIITLDCYDWFKTSFAQDRLCRYTSDCCVTLFLKRSAKQTEHDDESPIGEKKKRLLTVIHLSSLLTRSIIFSQGKGSKLAVAGVILE